MPGAWTAPATWTGAQLVSAADLNAQIRDNLLWLAGTTGNITMFATGVASTSNPTTTSASLVALSDPVIGITTLAGSNLLCFAQLCISNTTLGASNSFYLGIDAAITTPLMSTVQKVAGYGEIITLMASSINVTAVNHLVQVYWATSAGTLTRLGLQSAVVAVEFRR